MLSKRRNKQQVAMAAIYFIFRVGSGQWENPLCRGLFCVNEEERKREQWGVARSGYGLGPLTPRLSVFETPDHRCKELLSSPVSAFLSQTPPLHPAQIKYYNVLFLIIQSHRKSFRLSQSKCSFVYIDFHRRKDQRFHPLNLSSLNCWINFFAFFRIYICLLFLLLSLKYS